MSLKLELVSPCVTALGLHLVQAHVVHAGSLYEFKCVSVLRRLEGLVSLVSSIASDSYTFYATASARFQALKGKCLTDIFSLGLPVPRSLTLEHCLAMGFSICSHLL